MLRFLLLFVLGSLSTVNSFAASRVCVGIERGPEVALHSEVRAERDCEASVAANPLVAALLPDDVSAKTAPDAGSERRMNVDPNPLPMPKGHDSVVVRADQDAPSIMGDPITRVSAAEMEKAAGTLDDPMRYFQVLPGVLSDSDMRNDFLVRGGNPAETLFVVDGIEVPSVNQLALSDTTGGLVSMVDADAVSEMALHSGAHDARFSDRLSSVVEINTLSYAPEKSGTRRIFEAGIAGVGGLMSKDSGDGSYLVSARRSVLNLVTNDIGLDGVPIYTNTLLRGDRNFSGRDRVWGMSLTGVDSIKIRPDANDAAETNPFDVNYSGWRNTTGANWQHVFSGKTFGLMTVSNSEQSQSIVEYDQLLSNQATYTENTLDGDTTAKYEMTSQIMHWLLLSGGTSITQQRVNYGIDQPVPLPSPYSASPVSNEATSVNTAFNTPLLGGFAQGTVLLPAGMRLTLATRVSHWDFDGQTRWTPKAMLAVPLGGSRAISFGVAEYSQLPAFLYLLAFPSNHALLPIQAEHLTVDVKDLVRTRRFGMDLGAYEKRYSDYPVAANYPQLSMANTADTFGQSFLMFPMVSAGHGRNTGVEMNLHYRPTGRLMLQGSTTYARSWYSGLDGVMRRGNFDVPFSAQVASVFEMNHGLTLSMRYGAASGRPYTPDNMAESIAQDRDVYDLTRINGLRSQSYGRLDFKLEQSRRMIKGIMTWHVGLENALDRKNFYEYMWEPRSNPPGVSEQDQMPLFPDGGVKYSF